MSGQIANIEEDLEILEQMVEDMPDYLDSEALFWQKVDKKVEPTIGGFLMRQHRLHAVKGARLDHAQQVRLEQYSRRFDQLAHGQRFAEKAGQELEARLRQWSKMLDDLLADEFPSMAYYRADVEVRTIIEALVDRLSGAAPAELETLDRRLDERWQSGDFIWADEWQAAYPPAKYWWLYGELTPAS